MWSLILPIVAIIAIITIVTICIVGIVAIICIIRIIRIDSISRIRSRRITLNCTTLSRTILIGSAISTAIYWPVLIIIWAITSVIIASSVITISVIGIVSSVRIITRISRDIRVLCHIASINKH